MGIPLNQIPGFEQAIAAATSAEEALRDRAFIDCPHTLCGVLCKPLTLRHLTLFFAAHSPFFHAGELDIEHVAQFLWILSVDYLPAASMAHSTQANARLAARASRVRREFFARILDVDFAAAVAEIEEYLDETFMDRPPSTGPASIAITSFVANFVDEFAAEYGWDDERILDTPVARLYQYLRRIERRNNPKAVFFSKLTDRVRREIVAQWSAEERAKRPPKVKKPRQKKGASGG